jgi:hypothetical protein
LTPYKSLRKFQSSPKSRGRVAAEPRPAEPPRPSAQTQLSAPQSPKYEVTVRYAENQVLVTKFIDQNSGEVVQQIPPEQVLRIIESIQQLLKESANRACSIPSINRMRGFP